MIKVLIILVLGILIAWALIMEYYFYQTRKWLNKNRPDAYEDNQDA